MTEAMIHHFPSTTPEESDAFATPPQVINGLITVATKPAEFFVFDDDVQHEPHAFDATSEYPSVQMGNERHLSVVPNTKTEAGMHIFATIDVKSLLRNVVEDGDAYRLGTMLTLTGDEPLKEEQYSMQLSSFLQDCMDMLESAESEDERDRIKKAVMEVRGLASFLRKQQGNDGITVKEAAQDYLNLIEDQDKHTEKIESMIKVYKINKANAAEKLPPAAIEELRRLYVSGDAEMPLPLFDPEEFQTTRSAEAEAAMGDFSVRALKRTSSLRTKKGRAELREIAIDAILMKPVDTAEIAAGIEYREQEIAKCDEFTLAVSELAERLGVDFVNSPEISKRAVFGRIKKGKLPKIPTKERKFAITHQTSTPDQSQYQLNIASGVPE